MTSFGKYYLISVVVQIVVNLITVYMAKILINDYDYGLREIISEAKSGKMSATTSVKVAVRVRPMAAKELLANSSECVEIIPGTQQIIVGGGPGCGVGTETVYAFTQKSFTFDYLFDESTSQEFLFEQSVSQLVQRFLEGFNATILAYGQTGSGKTYSMGIGLEGINSAADPANQGIVPRAINTIFAYIEKRKTESPAYEATVTVSFMELYNEELIDLLHSRPRSAPHGPTIREDGSGKIVWQNLSEEAVDSTDELLNVLQRGTLCRTTGSTDMNASSSRSHAIFTVTLRQVTPGEDEGSIGNQILLSKFHFVDLAGSERLKRTNAEGDRKKEGISINQGLLALGNVISALGDESRKTGHVPYRDSKLTRMLQDSLGGNSQTLMLACISPSDLNYGETVNTLHYANRARNIKNKVAVNQDWAGSGGGEAQREIKALRATISQLRTEIALIRAGGLSNVVVEDLANPQENMKHLSEREQNYRQRRERDFLSEIDTLKVNSANNLFQLEKFQFLAARLTDKVKQLAKENLELTMDRDLAVAEKCKALNQNKLSRIPVVGEKVISETTEEHNKWYEENDDAPKKKLRRSRDPSPVASKVPDEYTHLIQEYTSAIAKLKYQLSECEDRLAWQNEAMSKLSNKSVKPKQAWSENDIAAFNIPKKPVFSRVNQIEGDSKEYSDFSREREVMKALRENIEFRDAVNNPLKELKEIQSKEPFTSAIAVDMDSHVDGGNEGEDPDVYLIINKIQNDIAQHEALVERIQKRDNEYEVMQKAYESKLKILQNQLSQIQKERDLALNKFGNSSGSAQQRNAAKSRFDEEKRRLDSQIDVYKRKMGENSRMQSNNKSRNDMLTKELQATIASLKAEKMRMLQDLRIQNQKHRDSQTANLREISKLRRKEKNAVDTARRLEKSNQLQRQMLKKRTEEFNKAQNKLQKVMSLLKRSATPNKIFKSTAALGFASPTQNRPGRKIGFTGSMNEMLASVNSPVRLSVSDKITEVHPSVEIHAQFKKQMIDKELAATVNCRKTQKTLQKLQLCRNKLIGEQKELIAERSRVVQAYYEATGVFDDKSPQYMDERVQAIDIEVASIDTQMISLEDNLRRNSGILDGDSIPVELADPSSIVELSWDNALNLVKSLDRLELETATTYFLEDLVNLRSLEEEMMEDITEKENAIANLRQKIQEIQESMLQEKLQEQKLFNPVVKEIDQQSNLENENVDVSNSTIVEEFNIKEALQKEDTLQKPISSKPLFPSRAPQKLFNENTSKLEESIDASNPIFRIPSPLRKAGIRPLSSTTQEGGDAAVFRGRPLVANRDLIVSPVVIKDRSQSPKKETSNFNRIVPKLNSLLQKEEPIEFLKEGRSDSANSMAKSDTLDDEPRTRKRVELAGLGGADVFKRLASAHTLASQAKVIHRGEKDGQELHLARKSLGDINDFESI
ncbi:Kinesin-like protein kif21b [Boothiomyces sp. JEL0838]|nr:Kinesin-like protein kif21b [Boothiomyces sp. JEL0838]